MNADSVRSVLGVPPNDLYFALLESIEKHDLKGTFAVVDKASETGVEFAPLLDGFAKFVRNRLYVKVGGISAEELNISEGLYEKLNSCAPSLGNGDLLRIARILTDLQGNIRRSTNPRLLVESAFARMAYLDRVVDLKRALAAINDPASQGSKKKLTEPQAQASTAAFTAPAPVPQAAPAPAAPSDSPFTIDFDSFDAPKASEPAPTVDFGGPEVDSSMMIDFGGAPAFDDEHGLDDTPNFVGSSDDFGGEQSITRYDICNSWQQLIRSSFSQEMGFFATSLNGSTLEHGDFQENPFRLKVVYPASFKWGYDQMMTREDYRERLTSLLEDRLQTKVSVTYELLEPKPGEEVSGVPLSPWESDLQKEPGLAEFTQRFMAELVATRSAPKNLDEENSDGEPCAVTPEQE